MRQPRNRNRPHLPTRKAQLKAGQQKPVSHAAGKVSLKKVTSRGKSYNQAWIHLPAALVRHPDFPFQDNDQVTIAIDRKSHSLIVVKYDAPNV